MKLINETRFAPCLKNKFIISTAMKRAKPKLSWYFNYGVSIEVACPYSHLVFLQCQLHLALSLLSLCLSTVTPEGKHNQAMSIFLLIRDMNDPH